MSLRRRGLLRAVPGALALGGLAGCSGTALPDGYSVRFDGRGWEPLLPFTTGSDHAEFYHGSPATVATAATHPYLTSNAVTMFVHRSTVRTDAHADALVVTYDAPDSDGGRAQLYLGESISTTDHVLVEDDEGGGSGPDSYGPTRFVHRWQADYTDGAVVSTAGLESPRFDVRNADGLDAIRVLSATSGGPTVESAGIDSIVQFRF